jgi:tripartite-type tricarboxylate transporter receptor subunit TctC
MKLFTAISRTLAALLLAAPTFAAFAQGDDYPRRPIRMVVAAPTGGLPDVIARLVGQHMAVTLGQGVAVENKTGAGGIIAADAVAKAAPDGYTILLLDMSPISITPTLYKKIPYEGSKSFDPVALLGVAPLFLTAGPSLKAGSFQEMVAQAKANPGKLTYGTIGIGSLHHIAFEEMQRAAGINMLHVPFREQPSGPAAGGQVDVLLAALPSIEGLVKGGKLRLLGATSSKRLAEAPNVPTLAELGLPNYSITADIGILAPKGTPPAITQQLAAAAVSALNQPDVRKRFAELGIVPDGRVGAEYGTYIDREVTRIGGILQRAGLAGSQ